MAVGPHRADGQGQCGTSAGRSFLHERAGQFDRTASGIRAIRDVQGLAGRTAEFPGCIASRGWFGVRQLLLRRRGVAQDASAMIAEFMKTVSPSRGSYRGVITAEYLILLTLVVALSPTE